MTALVERLTVRVMVVDVWDQVLLTVASTTVLAELKRSALERALGRRAVPMEDYVVKFRGARVLDESITLGALGVGPNAPFIVLPRRRQPVR